eukprot:4909876-Prorocentrum_lima.AAC.1
MTSSLVGSEMCIRDSIKLAPMLTRTPYNMEVILGWKIYKGRKTRNGPVSYTHLTLPTICSV